MPRGLVVVILSVLPILIFEWNPSNAARPGDPIRYYFNNKVVTHVPIAPVEERDFPPPKFTSVIKIGKRDTLGLILKKQDVAATEMAAALKALSKVYALRSIQPGQKILVELVPKNTTPKINILEKLVIRPNVYNEISVTRSGHGVFTVSKRKFAVNRKLSKSIGVIDSNLYLAATKAGVPAPVLMNLIRIFSWDVDFQRGIRAGDKFEVLFEALYTDSGDFIRYGNILYGNLILQGNSNPLYRFKTGKGLIDYFDKKGQSARKALLKTPVNGARLTSGFGKRRHPILGYNKMHRGIDFAAPRGTPIYAAGDGVVVRRSRYGAYGKYIKIRHNSNYATAYAHLKNYNKRVRVGRRVRQGQIIGYVGSTGRSTGPHLHYEVLRNSKRVNPLRVKMPSGIKLVRQDLKVFLSARKVIDKKYASIIANDKVAKSSH